MQRADFTLGTGMKDLIHRTFRVFRAQTVMFIQALLRGTQGAFTPAAFTGTHTHTRTEIRRQTRWDPRQNPH